MTIFYFFIFLIITHAQLECINMTMQIFKRERICYLFLPKPAELIQTFCP